MLVLASLAATWSGGQWLTHLVVGGELLPGHLEVVVFGGLVHYLLVLVAR